MYFYFFSKSLLVLKFVQTLPIDDERLEDEITAYTYNNKLKQYNYKAIQNLIDDIRVVPCMLYYHHSAMSTPISKRRAQLP